MKQSEHPDAETLVAYSGAPENNEFRQLRQHLSQCQQCRKTVAEYSMLVNKLQEFVPAFNTAIEEQDVLEVAQYIDGELDDPQQNNFGKKIRQDKNLMKAALHYSLHSAAMSDEIGADVTSSAAAKPGTKQAGYASSAITSKEKLQNIWLNFWRWQPSVWVSAPVTAILVIAVMVNLPAQQSNLVAVYQDEPILYFQKTTQIIPGIGFFNAARESEIEYGQVLASTGKQGRVTMQWPPVKNAEKYTVRISKIENNEKIIVGQRETIATAVIFPNFKPDVRHNYFWEISGKTTDGQFFRTEGGFVVTDN